MGPHRSPGQSLSHYAPRARVVLTTASDAAATWASLPEPAGVLAGTPPGPAIPWIPTPEDPADYAQALYGLLREVDARGWRAAAIVPPDARGVGLAVQDRLRRAAATRG